MVSGKGTTSVVPPNRVNAGAFSLRFCPPARHNHLRDEFLVFINPPPTGRTLTLWPRLHPGGTSDAPRRYLSNNSAEDDESVPKQQHNARPEIASLRSPSPRYY